MSPLADAQDFHFIFGLKPQIEPFHLAYYLCLASCRALHPRARIFLHLRNTPYGSWWDRATSLVTIERVADTPTDWVRDRYQQSGEGQFIARAELDYAHEADFLRLDILLQRGGIYADMDTLFVQPFDPEWSAHTCAMGEEQSIPDARGIDRPSLCNAVILAKPDAAFLRRWRSRMGDAFDGSWNNHSCAEASRLWQVAPDEITALPRERFYYFPWTRSGLSRLFESDATAELQRRGVYSIHLWSHLWWSETRTDFSAFHAGLITPELIRHGQSTFYRLAQRFMPDDAA